jgi:hypothetical protein
VNRTIESPFIDQQLFAHEAPFDGGALGALESPFVEALPPEAEFLKPFGHDADPDMAEIQGSGLWQDEQSEDDGGLIGADAEIDEAAFEYADQGPSAAELDGELFQRLVGLGPVVEQALVSAQIASGNRDVNALTNLIFFVRYPALKGTRLGKGQEPLMAEWLQIRDGIVNPALAKASPLPGGGVALPVDTTAVPLGTLTCNVPGRTPFSYSFTADDLLWTARFINGEAGGRDDAENRSVIWAMFNRYAFFRNDVPGWGSFSDFIRQYSTPLQPFLKSFASVKDWVAKCNSTFDNPGCNYQPTTSDVYPGTSVRKGQLKTFLKLQRTAWSSLKETSRRLAVQALSGYLDNPIGNASEFADSAVYFKRKYGRRPTRAEWEAYTREFAAKKKWVWSPGQAPYDEYGHNVLFVNGKAKDFPQNAAHLVRSTAQTSTQVDHSTMSEGELFSDEMTSLPGKRRAMAVSRPSMSPATHDISVYQELDSQDSHLEGWDEVAALRESPSSGDFDRELGDVADSGFVSDVPSTREISNVVPVGDPFEDEIDLKRAVIENARWAKQLKWASREAEIKKFLTFYASPLLHPLGLPVVTAEDLARSVGLWQQTKGDKAPDGVIGPNTWERLQHAMTRARPSPTSPFQTYPIANTEKTVDELAVEIYEAEYLRLEALESALYQFGEVMTAVSDAEGTAQFGSALKKYIDNTLLDALVKYSPVPTHVKEATSIAWGALDTLATESARAAQAREGAQLRDFVVQFSRATAAKKNELRKRRAGYFRDVKSGYGAHGDEFKQRLVGYLSWLDGAGNKGWLKGETVFEHLAFEWIRNTKKAFLRHSFVTESLVRVYVDGNDKIVRARINAPGGQKLAEQLLKDAHGDGLRPYLWPVRRIILYSKPEARSRLNADGSDDSRQQHGGDNYLVAKERFERLVAKNPSTRNVEEDSF